MTLTILPSDTLEHIREYLSVTDNTMLSLSCKQLDAGTYKVSRADISTADQLLWVIRDNRECELWMYAMNYAALGGHLTLLIWLRENGCLSDEKVCNSAAAGGNFHIVDWLHENGYCQCDGLL